MANKKSVSYLEAEMVLESDLTCQLTHILGTRKAALTGMNTSESDLSSNSMHGISLSRSFIV